MPATSSTANDSAVFSVTRLEALIAFIMSPASVIRELMPLPSVPAASAPASAAFFSCACWASLPSSDMTESMPLTALVT